MLIIYDKNTEKIVGHCSRVFDSGKWRESTLDEIYPNTDKSSLATAYMPDDARFIAAFAHSLEHTGGYSSDEARRVAGTLLPDIVRFDLARAKSYPSNGRALTDDVLDGFISILTNGKVTTDGGGSPQ